MKFLKIVLDWQSWFDPERFLDTLIIPVSIGVALIILAIEKNKRIQLLISKCFNADNSIIKFKEISGLKIFAIWNLLLGIGLIILGSIIIFRLNKGTDAEGFVSVTLVSFFGASLGWSYAFKYFAEAWKDKAATFSKVSLLFLILAIAEKTVNIYKGKIEVVSLFYFTIPPLILLTLSKTKKDTNEQSRIFWLSSLAFNLVLVGIFFIEGVGAIAPGVSSAVWFNSFFMIAPPLATYISIINLQKYFKSNSEETTKNNKILGIIAFSFMIFLTLLTSHGIKTIISMVQIKKIAY